MRNEMLRGRVLRYMYAFRLSRCGTRVAVCQQHFARRHLTQSRNNDENDFFSFPPSSLFLFQHDRSFFQSRFYTAAREKNDYPRSVNAKISSTGYDVFSLYRLYIEKSIGNDIRDNRSFEESLSFVKQFLAARLKRGPWKFARKIRLFQRRSLSSRYPSSLTGISLSRCLSACHDTMTVITTMNFKNAPNNEFLAEKGGEGRKRRRRRRRRKKGGIITG